MKTIYWGMIGVGNVTEKKSAPAFSKIPNSKLVAVCSRTFLRAKDYAQANNIEKVYEHVDDIISDSALDIIYIATPPDTHYELTTKALKAGKSVYVEKPMALSLEQAIQMNELAKATGNKLFVAFYRRSLSYFDKVKALLEEGVIGKVLSVSIQLIRPPHESDLNPETHTWRINKEIGGEGYFSDLAPHTFDILDYLIGPVVQASGSSVNIAGNYVVPDTVHAIWQHENGVLGTGSWIFSSSVQSQKDQVTIIGTAGEIRFSSFDFKPIDCATEKGTEHFPLEQPLHIQQPLIETIVGDLLGYDVCPSTGDSALRTTQIIDYILRSKRNS
ncbi:Gfo/Idh/MocA family protein [Sphingobacterium sp. LRF_L2]|uniref:Gfo/Idh/MocA family protein n=1 Tax=Sphingobacterium sp. LRF_L2 TaxID=3369421 RepID=UPI003F624669